MTQEAGGSTFDGRRGEHDEIFTPTNMDKATHWIWKANYCLFFPFWLDGLSFVLYRISWVRDGMFVYGTLQEWAYFPTCVPFEPELRNKNWIAAMGAFKYSQIQMPKMCVSGNWFQSGRIWQDSFCQHPTK